METHCPICGNPTDTGGNCPIGCKWGEQTNYGVIIEKLEAENARLKADIAVRDKHVDSLEADLAESKKAWKYPTPQHTPQQHAELTQAMWNIFRDGFNAAREKEGA